MSIEGKKVVILGSGYAGISTALALKKQKGLNITIVSPREGFLLNKISALRAATANDKW